MDMLKIWRSSKSRFGKFTVNPVPEGEETWNVNKVYTDAELAKIADSGFNAVWIHGLLHSIVKTDDFPELGEYAAEHQQRLNELTERAAKYGIKVFIYMQPPRALLTTHPIFKNHPEIAGQIESLQGCEGDMVNVQALCTSHESVKKYLKNAAAKLAEKVPDLGGIIMITASEYPAHCWSRRGRMMDANGHYQINPIACPRCKDRKPGEVVNEVIQLMRDGIRSVNQDWKIIAWNWSWAMYEDAPCENIIRNLPSDVILMADFERGGKRTILGKERIMDEYSLGYAGPSKQFRDSSEIARLYNRQMMAKLQIGTTHELATVPNLPIIGNIYRKAVNVRKMGLAGFMGTWNFGNMITANTAALNHFLEENISDDQALELRKFAETYFPGCHAGNIAEAWDKFAEAMDFYPFSIPYLYVGPTNYACILPMEPAPLTGKSSGRSWLMDERGDDISNAIAGYTIDEIIEGFNCLTKIWGTGVELLAEGLANVPSAHAEEELDNARVCYHLFKSTENFCKIFKIRSNWKAEKLPEYHAIAEAELKNLRLLLPLIEKDSRFGFHIEAFGYQFDAEQIKRKIETIEAQLLTAKGK
ncbi:MAG: hypothetical protein PHV75_08075 [Victivallaceae bacterium]|nr:hypothetical protein [Victivallaceae bacterium]MDD4318459.1 hypothetical protein [Victivallaceae bacterium]